MKVIFARAAIAIAAVAFAAVAGVATSGCGADDSEGRPSMPGTYTSGPTDGIDDSPSNRHPSDRDHRRRVVPSGDPAAVPSHPVRPLRPDPVDPDDPRGPEDPLDPQSDAPEPEEPPVFPPEVTEPEPTVP